MALLLNRRQALTALAGSGGGAKGGVGNGHRLAGRLTTDGKYAVGEAALTDPAYAAIAATLAAGTVDVPAGWNAATMTDPMTLLVDSKPMFINGSNKAYTLSEPADNVFRYEIRANEPGTLTDLGLGNRRCELVSFKENGYTSGQTLWMSWSTVLGTQHDGMFLTDLADRFGYVMQVHPPASKAPCVVVNYSQNLLRIMTSSDAEKVGADGVLKTRYSTAIPATGVVTNFVLAITFGSSGHLKAWVNGSSVYDADIPIGYYTDGGILGYPQWGVYEKNWNTTEVVYTANIEWGTADLSARAASPIAVPDLSPWA
ncbi:heparin lyase I family protein [Nocardioides hankookensis]